MFNTHMFVMTMLECFNLLAQFCNVISYVSCAANWIREANAE